ncbi:hypothetical protein FOZ62_023986 [Perkinsus olseni]|uniref:Fatty acid desaturase domain-containing protein n=2 Tax=Perkinsus olseni TaxID=32597 RepID=A0A7J6SFH0_PEROL|nr:hypothetical protein FOZ62_023986 [Perkinsus olseni]
MAYPPPYDLVFVTSFIATAVGLAVAFDRRTLRMMFFLQSSPTRWGQLALVALNWIVSWIFVTTFCLQSSGYRALRTAHALSDLPPVNPGETKDSSRYFPLLLGSLWYLVTVFACLSLHNRNGDDHHLHTRRTVCGVPHPVALYWVTTALVLAIDKNPTEAAVLVVSHLAAILLYKIYLSRPKGATTSGIPSKIGFFCGALPLVTAPLTAALVTTTILIYAVLNHLCWGTLVPRRLRQMVKEQGRGLLRTIARSIMTQERFYVYLPTYVLALVIPLSMLYVFVAEKAMPYDGWFMVNPVHFVVYHLFRLGPYFTFFAYTHATVHIEAHSSVPMFKGRWRVFNRLIEWGSFMFYGGVPEGYKVGHNKVHHKYNNGILDDSATMEFDRNHPRQFITYLGKFYLFWSGLSVAWHLHGRGERGLAWKQLKGTLAYYGIMLTLLTINWRFALAYWVYPHLEAVTLLAAVNYTWHAWVDPKDPDNDYITSITILDGHYNVFEADYHVVHHQHPTLWYEDYPRFFEKEIEIYKKHKATIFRGTQAFELFVLIITNNIDRLATLFVDLSGEMSHEEIKELLQYRMRAVPG